MPNKELEKLKKKFVSNKYQSVTYVSTCVFFNIVPRSVALVLGYFRFFLTDLQKLYEGNSNLNFSLYFFLNFL